MQLGMSLMGAGRLEEAIAPLERAAALAPTMFLPPIHLGLLYNELGRMEEAIRSVEAAHVPACRLLLEKNTTGDRYSTAVVATARDHGCADREASLFSPR